MFSKKFNTFAAFIGAAIVIAGCGGGSSSKLPAALPSAPSTHGTGSTSVAFVIKVPTKPASTQGLRRRQYISYATQSVAVTINSGTPTNINLTTGSPGCVSATSTTPLTCTVYIPAPPGSDTIVQKMYDGTNGTGNLLSTATTKTTVVAGKANTVAVTLSGVIRSLGTYLDNSNPPESLTSSANLYVYAYDADGYQITGPGAYNNGITIADSDTSGATSLSSTSISDPSVGYVTVNYNGADLSTPATFTVSSSGVSSATATLTPSEPSIWAQMYLYYNYTSMPSASIVFASGDSAQAGTATTDSGGYFNVQDWAAPTPSSPLSEYNIDYHKNYIVMGRATNGAEAWNMVYTGLNGESYLNYYTSVYTTAAALYAYYYGPSGDDGYDSWNLNSFISWIAVLRNTPNSAESSLLNDVYSYQASHVTEFPKAPNWNTGHSVNSQIATDLVNVHNSGDSALPTPCPSGCTGTPGP